MEDEALMRRAQRGDRAAFGLLFDRHAALLRRFLMRLVGEVATADDLVQETFFRAWTHRATFDEARSFRVWLYVLAKNAAWNELRRPHRRDVSLARLEDWEERGQDNDPAATLHTTFLRAAVERALRQLPPNQRLCLVLQEYEGYTFREIAAIIGCTEVAARVNSFRARARMKRLLRSFWESEYCHE